MKRLTVILIPLFFAACALIDDDLSVCGEELVITYQVELHTELSLQLQAELTTEVEVPVRNALGQWLSPIFSDKAKDIDLRFYSWGTDQLRYSVSEVINANQKSYTIVLPQENYMHLAVANIDDNHGMYLRGDDHSATAQVRVNEGAEIPSLNTGVFTARLPMQVSDSVRRFDVHLYMATAVVALVIDTTYCDELVSIRGKMNGGACGLSVYDSIFDHTSSRSFGLEEVQVKVPSAAPVRKGIQEGDTVIDARYACYATVGMPTRDDIPWTLDFVSTLTENRHTNTTLTIKDALEAGTLRIIKLKMGPKGELEPDEGSSEVGATVTLDWKDGGSHDVEL